VLAVLVPLAAGCGDDDADTRPDAARDDGGGGGDGGDGGNGPDAAPGLGQGFVLLRSASTGHLLQAGFTRTGSPGFCSYQTDGPCQIEICAAGTANPRPVAGDISITGGALALTSSAASGGRYADVTGTQDLWTGGETLRFQAPGADVPAFDVSVSAPGNVTPTAPNPNLASIDLTRGQPLALSWNGGATAGAATTHVVVLQATPLTVKCSFPAADGQGSIPASAIMRFPANSDGGYLTLAEAYRRMDVAGWDLRIAARRFAVTQRFRLP